MTSSQKILLKLENINLYKNGNPTPLIENLSFNIKEGEIIGILCENIDKAHFISLLLQKSPLKNYTLKGNIEFILKIDITNNVAYIPINSLNSLNPSRNLSKQLKDVINTYFTKKDEVNSLITKTLMELGLQGKEKEMAKNLSGGMRARFLLGLAFCTNAPLIVATNPFNALDTITQNNIINLILTKKKEGKSFIIIDTDPLLLNKLTQNIVSVNNTPLKIPTLNKNEDFSTNKIIVDIKNVSKTYSSRNNSPIKALTNISFSLYEGERLALIGESGGGKSTLANLITGLTPYNTGSIIAFGKELSTFTKKELKNYRKEIAIVFQDPKTAINPTFKVLDVLKEPFIIHKQKWEVHTLKELLYKVGLKVDLNTSAKTLTIKDLQLLSLAKALALHPKLLICDEVLSFMDTPTKINTLNLLTDLQKEYHFTIIFINHDLATVKNFATRVAVIKQGSLIELAKTQDLFNAPWHPYTKSLVNSSII